MLKQVKPLKRVSTGTNRWIREGYGRRTLKKVSTRMVSKWNSEKEKKLSK